MNQPWPPAFPPATPVIVPVVPPPVMTPPATPTSGTGTFGPAYDAPLDSSRIADQMVRIRDFMLAADWQTLDEISLVTGDPPASVSAQLRHLRKARFGSYTVDKRRRGAPGEGLWEYRVRMGVPAAPMQGQGGPGVV